MFRGSFEALWPGCLFFMGKMRRKKGKWPVYDEKYKTRAFLWYTIREKRLMAFSGRGM
jgi:hypothetical protein